METPMTTRPRSLNAVSNSSNHGISILQGPHQVAQKSSKTTFPLKSERRTVAPFTSFKAKSGAGLRSLSVFNAGAVPDAASTPLEGEEQPAIATKVSASSCSDRLGNRYPSYLNYICIRPPGKVVRNHSARVIRKRGFNVHSS